MIIFIVQISGIIFRLKPKTLPQKNTMLSAATNKRTIATADFAEVILAQLPYS